MFRNSYDSDNTVFSPQGRLFQVEYASEAVKQGSAAVGLRSKTHVILLALKRSPDELAEYQKKLIRIDDHIGIAIAGLTSDARVLSNFMRQQALGSKMSSRPIPVERLVDAIADKAQANTQNYSRRPYGVGFLVAGYDGTGPHLFEFSPSGVTHEYYAMSIGARSQSAKTYLESHLSEFQDCTLPELIKHGLYALRTTLQQDKELTIHNTSIGVIGPQPPHVPPMAVTDSKKSLEVLKKSFKVEGTDVQGDGRFRIVEGEELKVWLDSLDPVERSGEGAPGTGTGGADPSSEGAATSGEERTPASRSAGTGGDAMETD